MTSKMGSPQAGELGPTTLYGYVPSLAITSIFTVIFAVSFVIHVILGMKCKRKYWFQFMCHGALAETIGWAARIISNRHPTSHNAFIAQSTLLAFGPAVVLGTPYFIVGFLLKDMSPSVPGSLHPKIFLWTFIVISVVTTILSAVGSGLAAHDASHGLSTKVADDISLASQCSQSFGILVFEIICLYTLFVVPNASTTNMPRYKKGTGAIKKNPDGAATGAKEGIDSVMLKPLWISPRRVQVQILACMVTALFLLARSVYRIVALREGLTSHLLRDQLYFDLLDGMMLVLAIYTLIPFQPYFILGLPLSQQKSDASNDATHGGRLEKTHADRLEGGSPATTVVQSHQT